jgi:carboxylate-amine ligase
MSRLAFNTSPRPTLGVEIELALVDAESQALQSANEQVLARVPSHLNGSIKPELMQCFVEINSGIGNTVAEVETDVRQKIVVLESIADQLGLRLCWTSTHPFSRWRDQCVTNNERYQSLVKLLQDTARQLPTPGPHLHVAVATGD